jgi:eukaryotic-like serine/threonine-protein kinase
MEYLEGETVLERLAKGSLPLEQTLRYGVEIADALDKAHRQGIVHRDLKPSNVMLTKSGVKLLDFGLAKAVAPVAPQTSLTALPTQANLTQEGAILGTFQYMAPEQLEGKDADARTDIFALGAVLYEMATGRKAFSGATQASLIGAILHTDPPAISQVQPMSPPALDRVVRSCLAKDPEDRWQSAHDVAGELKWVAEGSQAGVPVPVTARRRNRERLAWGMMIVALLVALGAAAAAIRYGHRAAALSRPMRSSIVLPEKIALRGVALSPDGHRLAFVARDASGNNLLWVRPLDSLSSRPLPHTENSSFPFWSPDSRFIGFFADGKLKKIDASGGPPQTLCDAAAGRGGTWNREGVILFAPSAANLLYRVSAGGGGAPTPATQLDPARGEDGHRWPFFLPDGRHFVYSVTSFSSPHKERVGIYAGSLDSKEEKFLLRANSRVAYAPSFARASEGYLLFFRDGSLLAQPFDAAGLRIRGDPTPVAEQIQYFPQTYEVLFSASENGLLLYQPRSASAESRLVWFDRTGKEIGFLGASGDRANPRISPDGKRVALDVTDSKTVNTDVWLYESSRGTATRFTFDPGEDTGPIWSPDASRIVFSSSTVGTRIGLYMRDSSGAGSQELLLKSADPKSPADWSLDGRFILYRDFDTKTNEFSLKVLPVTGDRKPMLVVNTKGEKTAGQFSPDGRWVAHSSNESGRREVVVAPFPGPGGRWQVSTAGGSEPRWRRDGRELFYLAPDGKLMAVEVKQGPTFEVGEAIPLFQTRAREHISFTDLFSYDVSADGQRFLINTDVGEATSSPLTVVLNWTAELKK